MINKIIKRLINKNEVVIILLMVSLVSCNNGQSKENEDDLKQIPDEERSFILNPKELLKNPEFRTWDTNAKPTSWNINENFDKPEMYVIDRDTIDLLLKGIDNEKIYIKQKLKLDSNTFYVFEGTVNTRLKHDSYAGISIMEEDEIIGLRIFEKQNKHKYRTVFKTGENPNISCFIGFIEKGEGEIMIKSISLREVKLNFNKYESKIAEGFSNELNIDFSDAENFDKNIERIVRKISAILLAQKNNDSVNLKSKKLILPLLKDTSSFKGFLLESPETATKRFATKLIFSSHEIFNEFNIGVDIIELRQDKKRVHIALQYHNPYTNEWITIDPFYNFKVSSSVTDLNKITRKDIISINYGGLVNRVTDEVLNRYSDSKVLKYKTKKISYPY